MTPSMTPSVQRARWRPIYVMTAAVIIWIVTAVTLTVALVHFSRVKEQHTRPGAAPKFVGMANDLSDITIRPGCTWSDYPVGPHTAAIISDSRLWSPQTITGLYGGTDGRVVFVRSTSAPIILTGEDMRSLPEDRMMLSNGSAQIRADPEHAVVLVYSGLARRWLAMPMSLSSGGATSPLGAGSYAADVLDCPVRPSN